MSASTLERNLLSANTVKKGSLNKMPNKFMKELTQVKNHSSVNFVPDDLQQRQSAESIPKAKPGVLTVLDTKIEIRFFETFLLFHSAA